MQQYIDYHSNLARTQLASILLTKTAGIGAKNGINDQLDTPYGQS